jgi:hypothetical protein
MRLTPRVILARDQLQRAMPRHPLVVELSEALAEMQREGSESVVATEPKPAVVATSECPVCTARRVAKAAAQRRFRARVRR